MMKALSTFDLYLWNLFVPKLNEANFKNRMLCLLALLYVSLYKLPRKFLIHYFTGNGKEMLIDSKKLIMENECVLDQLYGSLAETKNNGSTKGFFNICQTAIHNPDYKYSVGSFTIDYLIQDESIEITVSSLYHFQKNPNRLTRHLHNWLYSMTIKGYAKSFRISSYPLSVTFSELNNAKLSTRPELQPKFAVLV